MKRWIPKLEPMEDGRPKFAHTMAYRFIESQIEKPLMGKPFVSAKSLIIKEAMVLEQCGFLASHCRDKKHLVFRILVASEGDEQKHLDVAKRWVSEYATPYADFSNTSPELVCNQACGNLQNEGIAHFLEDVSDRLEPERTMPQVNLWAHIGAYIGLKYPEMIEYWLFGGYHIDSKAAISWKSAALKVDHFLLSARANYTSKMLMKETAILFINFCESNYPEILEEFDFSFLDT